MKGFGERWNQTADGNEELRSYNGPLRFIRLVDLCLPLLKLQSLHEELKDLDGELVFWTGWPMFDDKIVSSNWTSFFYPRSLMTARTKMKQSVTYINIFTA